MTSGEFKPDSMVEATPMTPAEIYEQLRMIAFINKAFRSGKTDSYRLAVEQDAKPIAVDPAILPEGWQQPYTTKAFRFEAMRVKAPDGSQVLDFTYGRSWSRHHIQLPEHIAAYAFGAKKDPVRAAGPSTIVRSVAATIDSQDFLVDSQEAIRYFDSKGRPIVIINSDSHPDEKVDQTIFPRKPKPPITQVAPGKPIDIETVIGYDIPLTLRNDAVHFHETEIKSVRWKKLHKFIEDFDYEHRELILATDMLKQMQKAFRNQLGIRV